MFEQLYGTSKNMEGDDNDKILKESLTRELEKEMQRPDPEIDWEHVQAILKVLRPLESREERTRSDSPDKKEPTPEERTAAFIDRFNKRNGTNYAVSEEETKIRKLNTRKKLVRAAVLVGVVFGSFVTMNQVTMASANQSIFEFLGMKAAHFVYEMNAEKKKETPKFEVSSSASVKESELLDSYKGILSLPTDIPENMEISEIKEKVCNGIKDVYITYTDADDKEYIKILAYQSSEAKGGMKFFIGDEWKKVSIELNSGEEVEYYIGDECIKSILYIQDVLYEINSNIPEQAFVDMISSMEVIK